MNRWIGLGVFVAMFALGYLAWPAREPAGAGATPGRAVAEPPKRTLIPRGARPPIATPPTATPPTAAPGDPATPPTPTPPTAAPGDPAAAEAAPTPEDPDPASTGGVDPTIPLTAAGISGVADAMRPAIAACVDAWTVEHPDLDGNVLLAFQIGPDGIQDAWVVEHDAVPTGVLSCFSAAVYEQRWPAAPDGVEVTLPFEIERGLVDDAGNTELLDRR